MRASGSVNLETSPSSIGIGLCHDYARTTGSRFCIGSSSRTALRSVDPMYPVVCMRPARRAPSSLGRIPRMAKGSAGSARDMDDDLL